jgi:regulatory protein
MTEGKITQLKIQNRDKDRVSVFIDGEYAFSVSLLAAADLRRGQALSSVEMATLKQEGDVHLAYQRAVRYLGYRPRSVDETRRHLVDKGCDSDAVEAVISRLMRQGYLDDVAFANYWVENREQFRPRGRRALAYELRQKGVDGDVIDSVLERVEEDDLAWSAVAGKIERWADLEEYAFKQRVAGYLDRRGFPYGVSREVADRAWNDVNSEE